MASQRPYSPDSPEDRTRFEDEVERLRAAELPRVRDEETRAAAQRAVEREIELARESYRDELDEDVEEVAAETPEEERREAIRTVPAQILIGLAILLVLALIIASTRPGGIRSIFGGSSENATGGANGGAGQLQPILGTPGPGANGSPGAGAGTNSGGGAITVDGATGGNAILGLNGATLDSMFEAYWQQVGGVRICGYPLAPALTVQNRRIQWTERCRFESWPELAASGNSVQLGLLGREFTDWREFPKQQFFTSRPDLRFFPETSHGVGEPFLSFWEQNGGLAVFGYPISEVVQEKLDDGIIRSVQYFERARIEYHPDQPDPENQVLLGLLGRGLYLNESKPRIIEPLQPTPVPLP